MKRRSLAILLSTNATFLTHPAAAQDIFDLDTIIVSGSLSPVEADRSGSTVEVLTSEDLQQTDTTAINTLDRLPGVNSATSGGLGSTSSIQIRGLPARYVGVRINGIDVADPSGPQNQFNFGGLTSAGIGRVEVLKGSQSALFGSEAIGGLVDITTYRPTELGFSGSISVEGGSHDTYSSTLNLGYKGKRGEIALTYGYTESDGISARAGDAEDDRFEQDTITLFSQYQIADGVTLGGSVYYRDAEAEIDRSATDNTGINFSEELGYLLFTEVETGALTHRLSYAMFDVERRDPAGFTRVFEGERHQVSYLGTYEFGARSTFNFGIDHTEEDFSADLLSGSVDTTSVQAELLFSPAESIDLSMALRFDDDSDFGGKTTGRLAAVWHPMNELAVRAVVGTGFRAPSLFERFSSFGDPTLQPEESINYELGIEKTYSDRGFIKATLFLTEIDDLIDFDPAALACGGGFGCFNQVPGTTRSKGIELSGEHSINDRVTFFGNYTYTEAKTNGQRLTRTPKHDMTVGLRGDITHRLHGSADVRHVADLVASPFAPVGHKVGDYTLVGLGLTHETTANVETYMRIENLFDENYETAGGFNRPGRTAFFGVRASF